MTLTELRYIVTLAEEQHFGRAASRCHVSQPTLSIAVKKLEEELGLVLFERSKLRVKPSALGEQIVAKARGILNQTAAIRDLADAGKTQLNSPLALGVLPSVGPYLLPQLIPLLHELANEMPLYVDEGLSENLAKNLRNGDLDAIIVTQPFNETDVVTQTLFAEPLVALLPNNHRLAHKSFLEGSDLACADVLLPGENVCLRQQIEQAFPHLKMQEANSTDLPRSRFQSNSLEALRFMVASGLGVAILPQMAAENSLYTQNSMLIKHFVEPAPVRELALAWRVSFPRHKAIDVLRKALLTCSAAYWNFSGQRAYEPPGLIVENSNW